MPGPTLIRWSAEAVRDLEEIHEYIARNSPRYAAVVAGRLVAVVDRLGEFPEMGRIVPELGDSDIREIIHGAFRVVYELKGEWVDVLTIFRASRVLPLLDR
jgi:plasmid stabilization system protein ParE